MLFVFFDIFFDTNGDMNDMNVRISQSILYGFKYLYEFNSISFFSFLSFLIYYENRKFLLKFTKLKLNIDFEIGDIISIYFGR